MRRSALLACLLLTAAPRISSPTTPLNVVDPFDTSGAFFLAPMSAPPGYKRPLPLVGHLRGTITPQMLDEAKAVITSLPDHCRVYLDSLGGDVSSAMEIGRLIRAKHATAIVWQNSRCASACVLVLAGAADRITIGPVVIHRPYFSASPSEQSYTDTQKQFVGLRDVVRSYLQEMNVSVVLWDTMTSINPSDAHALTGEEMKNFGLFGVDPVEDEMRRQGHAKALGITIEEYLQREALAKQRCVLPNTGDVASPDELATSMLCNQNVMSGAK
jgi:ATP-dependent protease ClpP protease subunit